MDVVLLQILSSEQVVEVAQVPNPLCPRWALILPEVSLWNFPAVSVLLREAVFLLW